VASVVPVPCDATPYQTLSEFSRQLQCMLGARDGLLSLKDLDGRYLFMNRRLAEVLGVRRDDATGRTDHELLPRELADVRVESDRRALESREAIGVEQRLGTDDEATVLRTLKFPLIDDRGEPYAVAGLSADVTSLDRAQRELRARLEGAPVALLGVDADGRVSFANERARALAADCDDLQLGHRRGRAAGGLPRGGRRDREGRDRGRPPDLVQARLRTARRLRPVAGDRRRAPRRRRRDVRAARRDQGARAPAES